MAARGRTFRLVLALLMAVWSPVCLCQRSHTLAAARGPSQEVVRSHHDGADEHHHRVDATDPHQPSDENGEPGAPCHDHDGPGCECSKLAPANVKPKQGLKATISQLVVTLQWSLFEPVRPGAVVAPLIRDSNPAPRPPTTLLGMHCALIV